MLVEIGRLKISHCRKEKIFEDSELEALLYEDSCQMQEELAESLGVKLGSVRVEAKRC